METINNSGFTTRVLTATFQPAMNNCLTGLELKELGESKIVDFDKRVASIPDYLCAPFHQEARQLETELLTIYSFVALGVRKEQDLNAVAGAWGAMVEMCD